ncbi:hypothetical protein D5018_14105 [Parashewanella curva]|uniref:Uncharacterized protein n=1 Tax=Parashewanella curva TaxID=2338552 RepID=A0A3L8PWA2_9GAMM|nr:hypothetical protein [Parashewanella curva]RLV59079.1 hypothetical protein D5018_14105 [Parashewanella curva]
MKTSHLLLGLPFLLPIQVFAHTTISGKETVREICIMASKELLSKNIMPSAAVTCYSKLFPQKTYFNIQDMFKDGWEPISVGVGQGEAATAYDNTPYQDPAQINSDTMQSLGIVVEKTIN